MSWKTGREPVTKPSSRIPALSGKEAVILDLLCPGADEMYGLELVAASDGRLKRGTVYVTLGRMEEKGYVQSRLEEPRPGVAGLPRRLYRATATGQRLLKLVKAFQRQLALEPAR